MKNTQIEDFAKIGLRAFQVMFAIFIFLVFGLSGRYTIKLYQYNDGANIIVLFWLAFFGSMFLMSFWFCNKKHYNVSNYILMLLLCYGVLTRLPIVGIMGIDTAQLSDFAMAYDASLKSFTEIGAIDTYRAFSNWVMYVLYLKLINTLFYTAPSTAIVFNAILTSLSACFLYLIIKRITQKKYISFAASILFLTWPSFLFYTVVLSPEFVNIFLVLLAIYLYILSVDFIKFKQKIVLLICSGACFSLSAFFKSTSIIFIIALIILSFLSLINNNFNFKRFCINKIFPALFLVIIYFLCLNIIYSSLDTSLNTKLSRNNTAHFIYIGLNPYSVGDWNEKASIYPQLIKDYDYDEKRTNERVFEILREDIERYHHLTFDYFKTKFLKTWENDSGVWWAVESISENNPYIIKSNLYTPLLMICQSYYFIIIFLITASSLKGFGKYNWIKILSQLVIFGFFILELIIEVQSRYKIVFYPYMAYLAADGLEHVLFLCLNFAKRVRALIKGQIPVHSIFTS